MRNILLLLKILDNDFQLNYKKLLTFINLGIFLCWGCLFAAFVTGAFETRLEKRISFKNNQEFLKLSLMKLNDILLDEMNFFRVMNRNIASSKFDNRSTMFPYIVKFNNSIKRNIIYLKEDESYFDFLYQIYPSFKKPTSLYQNSEDEHKKLSKIEEDFEKLINSHNQLKDSWSFKEYEKYFSLSQDNTSLLLDLYKYKIENIEISIKKSQKEISNYNNWSSLTFIVTFLIQLLIFIFIQTFEVSIERRKIKKNEN